MEDTFMRSQAHAANLMSLIEGSKDVQSQATEAVKAVQRGTNHRNEGLALATLYNLDVNRQAHDARPTNYQLEPLSHEESQLLKAHVAEKYGSMDVDTPDHERFRVHKLKDIEINALRYTCIGISTYDCDARVCAIVNGKKEMGIIQHILQTRIRNTSRPPLAEQYSGTDTYLIFQLFTPPTLPHEDPYAAWQRHLNTVGLDITGHLYNPMATNPPRVVIEPENIQGHIACTDITPGLVHIKQVSRVRQSTSLCKMKLISVPYEQHLQITKAEDDDEPEFESEEDGSEDGLNLEDDTMASKSSDDFKDGSEYELEYM
jgi:hypothetical protein